MLKDEIFTQIKNYFLSMGELAKIYVHGSNILQKVQHENDEKKLKILKEVFTKYKMWKEQSEKNSFLLSNELQEEKKIKIINELTSQLNFYKDYITKINLNHLNYRSQSKFESTILEEFIAILFKPLIDKNIKNAKLDVQTNGKYSVGNIRAYSNLYFSPQNFNSFLTNPSIKINSKDQDFAIYRNIEINIEDKIERIAVPIVSLECKTYLDKTMLEGSIATAEKIKMGNPYCLFFIVTETYDVDFNVDPAYSRIDGIFVLRKQKRDRSNNINPIDYKVLYELYSCIEKHIASQWSDIEYRLQNYGRII